MLGYSEEDIVLANATLEKNCVKDKEEKVYIYNKIRERFIIDVTKKIHLHRIVIDSLDSILPQDENLYPCLNSYSQRCCKLEGDIIVNDGNQNRN